MRTLNGAGADCKLSQSRSQQLTGDKLEDGTLKTKYRQRTVSKTKTTQT